MGTAVSRLRRPCLSLRLLLYRAISSRAEVAGSGVTSGLAAVPGRGEKKRKERENAFELLQFPIFSCDSICCRKDQSDRTEDPCESRDPARDTPHLEQQLETSRKQMHPISVLNSNP